MSRVRILAGAGLLLSLAACSGGQEFRKPLRPDRVLMLAGENFEPAELWVPYYALSAAGYTVDIAAVEAGTLRTGGSDRNAAPANLSLDDVDVRNYAGLVVPGGSGVAQLRRSARALVVCREFMDANRTVAAISGGLCLLAEARVLWGRVITGPWSLADDAPRLWSARAFGTYVDREVIVDRNLVTSRAGLDLLPFCRAVLVELTRRGGLAYRPAWGRALVLNTGLSGHAAWAYTDALRACGLDANLATPADAAAADASQFDLLVVPEGDGFDRLRRDENFAAAVRKFKGTRAGRPRIVAVGEAFLLLDEAHLAGSDVLAVPESVQGSLGKVIAQARRVSGPPEGSPPPPLTCDAVLALHEGFDDRAASAAEAILRLQGRRVAHLSPTGGWVRGLNGSAVLCDANYLGGCTLEPNAVIVAPGGVWPSRDNDARRRAWMLSRYDEGATLVLVGLDSLLLADDSRFAGMAFASSEQARWSFARKAARFTDAPVARGAARLITARDATAVVEAMKLASEK